MRIAVIGAGRMSAIRVEDLAADPRVDEVIVTNRTDHRAADLARRFAATPLPWSERAGIQADATVVAVSTDVHADLLTGILEGGRPVLCEKPIGLTLEDTDAVITVAERHGTPLQIGFQRRFDPGLRDLHDRVADGSVGTIYSMSLLSHDHVPSTVEFLAGSGGIFRDLHVHDADLIRWIGGAEIETVFATKAVRAHEQYSEFDDADVTVIHALTANGIQVVIRGARHDPLGYDVRVEVHGSLDSLTSGLTSRTPLRTMDGDLRIGPDTDALTGPYAGFVDRFRQAFRNETAAFVDLALGEIANPCPPDSARESLRFAIACERSVATGRPVRVADIS